MMRMLKHSQVELSLSAKMASPHWALPLLHSVTCINIFSRESSLQIPTVAEISSATNINWTPVKCLNWPQWRLSDAVNEDFFWIFKTQRIWPDCMPELRPASPTRNKSRSSSTMSIPAYAYQWISWYSEVWHFVLGWLSCTMNKVSPNPLSKNVNGICVNYLYICIIRHILCLWKRYLSL